MAENINLRRERGRKYARQMRVKVLSFYSGGEPKCNCCGEQEIKFLCVDHINNDGYMTKRFSDGRRAAGSELYRWIIKNNFPDKFQILCHNCNSAKGFYGECPHQERRVGVRKGLPINITL